MTKTYFAVTRGVVEAWVTELTLAGLDGRSRSKPAMSNVEEAARTGVSLFEHLCSFGERDETGMDMGHPDWDAYMQTLDAAMRRWHFGAERLAALVRRHARGAAGSHEFGFAAFRLIDSADRVGKAIKK